MIKKSNEIIQFLSLLNVIYNNKPVFVIKDLWDSEYAIGLEKDNKLIYIAIYDKDDYFYSCELLTKNGDYIVEDSNNSTEQELLEVISKFFCIAKAK